MKKEMKEGRKKGKEKVSTREKGNEVIAIPDIWTCSFQASGTGLQKSLEMQTREAFEF